MIKKLDVKNWDGKCLCGNGFRVNWIYRNPKTGVLNLVCGPCLIKKMQEDASSNNVYNNEQKLIKSS